MTAALVPHTLSNPTRPGGAGTCPRRAPLDPEVYRRRRLAVIALVVGLLLGLVSFGRQAEATRTPEAEAAEAVLVVVQPGDTLWAIARSLAPEGDPRPLVASLGEIAGGGPLQPGQLLTIPGDLLE